MAIQCLHSVAYEVDQVASGISEMINFQTTKMAECSAQLSHPDNTISQHVEQCGRRGIATMATGRLPSKPQPKYQRTNIDADNNRRVRHQINFAALDSVGFGGVAPGKSQQAGGPAQLAAPRQPQTSTRQHPGQHPTQQQQQLAVGGRSSGNATAPAAPAVPRAPVAPRAPMGRPAGPPPTAPPAVPSARPPPPPPTGGKPQLAAPRASPRPSPAASPTNSPKPSPRLIRSPLGTGVLPPPPPPPPPSAAAKPAAAGAPPPPPPPMPAPGVCVGSGGLHHPHPHHLAVQSLCWRHHHHHHHTIDGKQAAACTTSRIVVRWV
jgi:hypothetical protein